ncbi:hypothetical protein QBC33DRAFT_530866 [Phialemonium atrogriseum]|uniref:Uncharacterized protein n=1 Tax=Phialemonium atrogriseum TaxID=1093897 RepID=A0AAJ0C865_9PEZI|nr:uncharacterized protein QBC33DRAFT_530866 [Phialemonium atrogriseum]KAK1769476.1 hypothetical protein QBC33DRAFT_530866 [Phialemonium atrogriseum]
MSDNHSVDAKGIRKFLEPFEEDVFEKYFDTKRYYNEDPSPSHTDDSETSALFTEGGATSVTAPTSIGSPPEGPSAPQWARDEDVQLPNATHVGDNHAHYLILPTFESATEIPRPPTLMSFAPNTPAIATPGPRPWDLFLPPRPTRNLRDPEETARIRELTSCRRCKILKTACQSQDICDPCKRWDDKNHERLCIRKTLESTLMGASIQRRWLSAWLGHPRLGGADPEPSDQLYIDVIFSEADPKPLRVYVCPYVLGQGQCVLGVAPNRSPSAEELHEWAAFQLKRRAEDDFRGVIDSFLVLYARSGYPEKNPLVENVAKNVVKMSAMWHILNAKMLYCRHDLFPPRVIIAPEAVQVHIQRLAQQMMTSLEHKILRNIDDLVPDTAKNFADRPVIWSILWGVILIYRQSLDECQRAKDKPSSWETSEACQDREDFINVTSQLLDSLIVTYSSRFRTRGVQDTLNSSDKTFPHQFAVREAFEAARKVKSQFYDQVSKREQDHDNLIMKHVIEPERQVMKRGYRRAKPR